METRLFRCCFFVGLTIWLGSAESTLRDQSGQNRDAVSKVHTEILDATDAGVPLRCEIKEAFPKPDVSWEDDGGNLVPASETRISRGGRVNVSITANVTKTATNNFYCVVRQKEILHEFREKIYVPGKMFQVCEDNSSSNVTGMSTGVWVGILIGGILIGVVVTIVVTSALIKTRCQFVLRVLDRHYSSVPRAPSIERNGEERQMRNGQPLNDDIELLDTSSSGHQS